MSDEAWLAEIAAAFCARCRAGFGPPTVDVEAADWESAVTTARDVLGCGFFDYLTAVDELEDGFAVVLHLARPSSRPGRLGVAPYAGATRGCVAGDGPRCLRRGGLA